MHDTTSPQQVAPIPNGAEKAIPIARLILLGLLFHVKKGWKSAFVLSWCFASAVKSQIPTQMSSACVSDISNLPIQCFRPPGRHLFEVESPDDGPDACWQNTIHHILTTDQVEVAVGTVKSNLFAPRLFKSSPQNVLAF